MTADKRRARRLRSISGAGRFESREPVTTGSGANLFVATSIAAQRIPESYEVVEVRLIATRQSEPKGTE